LTAYQDAAYAARYRRRVDAVRAAEGAHTPGKSGLAEAVARYLFKLMAYKDEYEVARLHADPAFLQQVRNEVDGDNLRLVFHRAPAASRPPRQDDGRAAQDELRAVDAHGIRRARSAEVPARDRARPVRLHRRAQGRAPAGVRL